jgi:hydroxyacylglutathione hydrolase
VGFTEDHLIPIVDEGLGNSSYLVDLGDERALAVAASRDLRALGTPGHTEEHLSYLLLDGDVALGVFSGGSLIVGAAARTDLVDPTRALDLARAQYASLQRLAGLPDHTALWPTHGAGSFCAAPPGTGRTSTIGVQKHTNPLLGALDADAFADQLLDQLGAFPPYFLRLGEVNRTGPAAPDTRSDHRPQVLDVRQDSEYASGHLPGALNWQLGELPAHQSEDQAEPYLVMCGHGERAATAASLLLRAGPRDVAVLDGGPAQWADTTGEALVEEHR